MCYTIITDADGLKRESESVMKKVALLILSITILICLVACNQGQNQNPTPEHTHIFGEGDATCSVCGQPMEPTEGIIYDISDDGTYAMVVGYEGSATKIKIADAYEGLPVKTIYNYAFYGNKAITSVIIPDSVTSIGVGAFVVCDRLTSVVIPGSVTSIGDEAFGGCFSLTSVEIPDSVTSIGDLAFYGCTNIIVNEGNKYYKSIDGNLYTKDEKTLIQYAIGKQDKSFIVPDSVTSIGKYVFYNCTGLTSVEIPDSVTSIGESAFYYCYNLKDVYYTGSEAEWQAISIDNLYGSNNYLVDATIHYNYVPEN